MPELNTYIEHALLKQNALKKELRTLFEDAAKYNFWGVCIHPLYVADAKKYLSKTNVKIVTVIGFPLGANKTEVKVCEALEALKDGADEFDMVLNVSALKDNNDAFVFEDIKAVRDAVKGKILKVIVETDLLEPEEIKRACLLAAKAKADFVKTSTGFVKNGVGATVQNVKLMYETVNPIGLKVKASGGIKDKKTALELIKAGAVRLGTSQGVKIFKGE